MLFNSFEFAVFLIGVFFIYWFLTNHNLRLQNLFILSMSYLFYGWWDWRFLSLLAFSSLVDYTVGRSLNRFNNPQIRKSLLLLSIIVNVGFSGFFKYFNFSADNFVDAFSLLGVNLNRTSLNIILPVGISFYTFQTLSYSIDVYRGKMQSTKDIISFMAFVSFFPQLVAGPIERAKNLLPQFFKKRTFNVQQATDGLKQILWGLFKKMVIADNCAFYADVIFDNYTDYSGTTLLFGSFMFAIQIYGDFSGYSDIAIGIARLFGFELTKNFAFPYFSRDIAEFWRRWHISLSTWFRDYVYIPLGGSKSGIKKQLINTLIIFVVSGFWHGANWTFIAWGVLNAIYFIPLFLLKKNRTNMNIIASDSILPNLKELRQMSSTFFLTLIAWIFFRSQNIWHALKYTKLLFVSMLIDPGYPLLYIKKKPAFFCILILFIITEWLNRKKEYGLQINMGKIPRYIRWIGYYILIGLIIWWGGKQNNFIYFQF